MIKVALISRRTLFTVKGGDTVQIIETARQLTQLGIHADIILSNEKVDYKKYDLLHFFNITRPADILKHIQKTTKKIIITPIWIDYSFYDKHIRKGIASLFFSKLSPNRIEYIKTIARWFRRKDSWPGFTYLLKGQQKSITTVLNQATMLFPNSMAEYETIKRHFSYIPSHTIIPLGIDEELFQYDQKVRKQNNMVICVARIEGIKNQLNLIKALNNTPYNLYLIGAAAPNQKEYYNECKKRAAENIFFIEHLPQKKLIEYYKAAKVHILPSWYESCGLASMEAAAMCCNIVVTRNGFASSYFHEEALYCDPASPSSILSAIENAAKKEVSISLQQQIITKFTWQQTALKTKEAYQEVLSKK